MSNSPLRAAGYRRVSMREQVDGFSLDAQETNIRQYVQSQGWELVQLYTDAGISAKKDSQRPSLAQLMNDAQAGHFDVVVVDKVDRFYRHLRGLLAALDQLNGLNVSFVSVQERLDFTTIWGKLTLALLGTLAEIYVDNLRQETHKGKLQRARDGLWNGNPPFGYCRGRCSNCAEPNGPGYCPRVGQPDLGDGKHLQLHPLESRVVRQIYDWYLTGKELDGHIAVSLSQYSLDKDDLRPRSRGIPGQMLPGPMQKDLVRNILTNLFYTGVVPYYGPHPDGTRADRHPQMVFPGRHPAIIQPEEFELVQELRRMLGTTPRLRKATVTRDYLLSGLLRCGYCGRNMRGSSSCQGKKHYYRDTTHIEKSGECPQCTLPAEVIETEFLNWLRTTLANEAALEQIQAQQASLQEIQLRYERARNLYLAGQLNKKEYDVEEIRHANGTKPLQENEFGASIASFTKMRQSIAVWHDLSTTEQKRLFRMMGATTIGSG